MLARELYARTCETFGALGIKYAVVGGFAGIIHGSSIATADIDLVIMPERISSNY